MYRKDINKGFIKGIYEGSVCMTWGTSENHIRLRPKVRGSILGSLYGKVKDPNGDFNGILPINGWINKETEPDVRIVFITLCQLHTEQLGIVITNYIVYIQCNTIRGNQDITIQGKLRIYTKDINDTKISKEDKQKC